MARGVVLRLREGPAVVDQTLVHKVAQLGKGLAQDEPPVVRDLHLPQRLDDERIALAAACRAAVESLRLRPAHELPLPGLGPPDDRRIRSCLHTSSTGGSSTTPHLPALRIRALFVQRLGHSGQVFEHRSGFLQALHGPGRLCTVAAGRFLTGVQLLHLLRQHRAQRVRGAVQVVQPLARRRSYLLRHSVCFTSFRFDLST